jgi:hypothetical protein
MVNPDFRDVVLEANEVQALAQSLGIEVATLQDLARGGDHARP